jgi:hypothetical protein
VSIKRRWREVYDFAADPANLPQWAAGLAGAEVVREADGDWVTQSPMGTVTVAFAAANELGVLDHDVTLPSGEVVANPVRVFPNGDDGCDVVFTVRRRDGMTDDDLRRDTAAVEADLQTLRRLMEM